MREIILAAPQLALAIGGFAIGLAFGWITRATNYCLMGAMSDWRLTGDMTRLGGAALAAAVAIIGAQTLDAAGVVDLSQSMYVGARINWLGAGLGGFIFGAGMVYAGGCPSRALVRAGGGDIRAAITLLVMATAAYAALSGVFGALRVAAEQATAFDATGFGLPRQDLPTAFARLGWPRLLTSGVVASGLLAFAAISITPDGRRRQVLAGLGVGASVTLGWALSGLAYDEMAANPLQPASLSFVKPVADAIDWIERSTALGIPTFAAASVFGVIAGGFVAAVIARELRFHGFADGGDLKRHLGGAVAMGIGGVLGLGCTIGQGVTGVSTLAAQSFLAVAAMMAGAAFAIRRLQKSL